MRSDLRVDPLTYASYLQHCGIGLAFAIILTTEPIGRRFFEGGVRQWPMLRRTSPTLLSFREPTSKPQYVVGSPPRGCAFWSENPGAESLLSRKEIGLTDYPCTIWLSANMLDHESPVDFERAIALRHPLVEILRLAPTRCLVVFDGVEAYTERALRMTARTTTQLLSSKAAHVHLLISLQFESADAKMRRLATLGIPQELLEITPIGRPEPDEIQKLLSPFPALQWLSLRPQLRPLLTNLKVLDWFARIPPKSQAADDQNYIGLAGVIDQLWELWTESPADGLARSHLLMKLATTEAETLSRAVPRTQLGHNEQQTLPGLEQSGLIRIRDDRVSLVVRILHLVPRKPAETGGKAGLFTVPSVAFAPLAHDLLGDWARLRVLVAEDATSTATESRAASPRWQQAVRLFGQRLLEASADGQTRWRQSVESVKDESPSTGLMRDLFLDALFQATNAIELLNLTWDTLISGNGALLNRLLDRFLFVASLPDPRLAVLSSDVEEATRVEHLLRVPFWPYWGPVLTVLHARRRDVARLAPYTAARVCALWLSTMPDELGPSQPTPWRIQAAELALEIAREIQALVLLAVSIESPQHDDFTRSSLPECGLSSWPEGDPPAYFRGPFLQFFRLAPTEALSFVIKLTNFGTHRYTEDRVWLDVTLDGQVRHWYGNSNVFRWHHDCPLSHGSQIQSSLMALEQWLYEQIDQGITIEPWIARILAESESLVVRI
jgi:hypothetical protein